MHRRRFIAGLGTAGVAATAGCLGDNRGQDDDTATDTETSTRTPTDSPTATDGGAPTEVYGDVTLPVPKEELRRGAPKDGIPAIVDPAFGSDWSSVEATLDDDEEVVGVEAEGRSRAYPLNVLNWHEIVNDDFGGPLLVTFCPLCGSAVVADRLVDGEPTTFGVSGYLWKSDLVMYDRATDSLWSQILATAINGPKTGSSLQLRPSTITTWGDWRAAHPDTEVLLPPPRSNTVVGSVSRNYERNPYAGYESSRDIGISGRSMTGSVLHPKTRVVGVVDGDAAKAYPLDEVVAAGVVNDRVGDVPVVVAGTDGGTLVAYVRRVDGEVLEFTRDGDHLVAGGSQWNLQTGRAVDGPHEGTTLERANDRSPMFWFAWENFNPDTEIYGVETGG